MVCGQKEKPSKARDSSPSERLRDASCGETPRRPSPPSTDSPQLRDKAGIPGLRMRQPCRSGCRLGRAAACTKRKVDSDAVTCCCSLTAAEPALSPGQCCRCAVGARFTVPDQIHRTERVDVLCALMCVLSCAGPARGRAAGRETRPALKPQAKREGDTLCVFLYKHTRQYTTGHTCVSPRPA